MKEKEKHPKVIIPNTKPPYIIPQERAKLPVNYIGKVNYAAIGKKLRKEREHMGYTQEQVAEAIDLTPAFVGHIERGERSMSLNTLICLCNFYNITMDYLLSDTLPPEGNNAVSQIAVMLKDKTPQQQAAILDILRTITRHI